MNLSDLFNIPTENHARVGDPSTSHQAAAKARKRHIEYVFACDDAERRGVICDEVRAKHEFIRMEAVTNAERTGQPCSYQRTPYMSDQWSSLPSKLIRGGVALYTSETRQSIRGGKQLVLVMTRHLSIEEIVELLKMDENKHFGYELGKFNWKHLPTGVSESTFSLLRYVIPDVVKKYELEKAEKTKQSVTKKAEKAAVNAQQSELPDWLTGKQS